MNWKNRNILYGIHYYRPVYIILQCLMFVHSESDNEKLLLRKEEFLPLSADNNLFWQLTDIHWDLLYSKDGDERDMCHKSSNLQSKSNGVYGNYFCDAPYSLVISAIHAMKDIESRPKFILWTGDNAPHTKEASFDVIFKTIRNLTMELQSVFGSSIPLIPVLGNHDAYPKDFFPPSGDAFYSRYLLEGNWTEILSEDALVDFRRGGYYKTNVTEEVDVLILNTNLYYRQNKIGQGLEDPGDQFAWMKRCLQEAKDENKKVLVAAHAPPGYWERNPSVPFFNDSYNDKYVDILNEFGDVIMAQIYGHQHTDSFKLFGAPDNAKSIGFLAPSLTPWFPTRLLGGTAINPSLRLYSFSPSQILDYVQYQLNLTEANNSTAPEACPKDQVCNESLSGLWKKFYTASEFFGVNSLSVSNMVKVFQRFASNDTFFQEYFNKNSAGIEHGYCNETCKKAQICAISHLKIGSVELCLNNSMSDFNAMLNSSYHVGEYYDHISLVSVLIKNSLVTVLTFSTIIVLLLVFVFQRRKKGDIHIGDSSSFKHNGSYDYKPLSVDETD